MTIIRHNVISGAALVDAHLPRIGYTNLFRGPGTVAASTEDSDYPKENAFNGLTYDGWRGTGTGNDEWLRVQVAPQNADYMAVAVHTLANSIVTPQRSNDGSAWTDLDNAYAVPDNRPIVWEFPSVSAAYWRLLVQGPLEVVGIGAIHVGLKTPLQFGLPQGWEPPSLNEDVEFTNSISEGGQTLGRSVLRRGAKAEVASEMVSYIWARDTWLAFQEVAESYAVFFWWTYDGRAEIIYGGVMDKQARFRTTRDISTQFRIAGINR